MLRRFWLSCEVLNFEKRSACAWRRLACEQTWKRRRLCEQKRLILPSSEPSSDGGAIISKLMLSLARPESPPVALVSLTHQGPWDNEMTFAYDSRPAPVAPREQERRWRWRDAGLTGRRSRYSVTLDLKYQNTARIRCRTKPLSRPPYRFQCGSQRNPSGLMGVIGSGVRHECIVSGARHLDFNQYGDRRGFAL